MAREHLGQILIDNECVMSVSEMRKLLVSGAVKQGDRVLTNKNEKIDTADGPITVWTRTTIFSWDDHSVS
jgi:hypothetical protein